MPYMGPTLSALMRRWPSLPELSVKQVCPPDKKNTVKLVGWQGWPPRVPLSKVHDNKYSRRSSIAILWSSPRLNSESDILRKDRRTSFKSQMEMAGNDSIWGYSTVDCVLKGNSKYLVMLTLTSRKNTVAPVSKIMNHINRRITDLVSKI